MVKGQAALSRQGKEQNSEVRIIAGRWRGRRISFPVLGGLRPTSDRLRETLFNWLQFSIHAQTCLDAFAGSGALGFEALSRGAKEVVFLDTASAVVKNIKAVADDLLKIKNYQAQQVSALQYFEQATKQFDLIFLDPPFQEQCWQACLEKILEKNLLSSEGLVYIEMPLTHVLEFEPKWRVIKETRVGQVRGQLIQPIHKV